MKTNQAKLNEIKEKKKRLQKKKKELSNKIEKREGDNVWCYNSNENREVNTLNNEIKNLNAMEKEYERIIELGPIASNRKNVSTYTATRWGKEIGANLNRACAVKKRAYKRRKINLNLVNNEIKTKKKMIKEMNNGTRNENKKYQKWAEKEKKKLETKRRQLREKLSQINREMTNLHRVWRH